MIQPKSKVIIADNSGAKIGQVFKVLGHAGKRYAEIGDIVVIAVQKAEPRKQVKKKDVMHAVVVRQTKPFRRKDGAYVRFDENSIVLLGKGTKEPIANRIFGPVPRELVEMGYQTIVSMAPEVI